MTTQTKDTDKQEQTYQEFKENVNMTPAKLQKWLESDDSQSVGIRSGTSADKKTSTAGGESTGHESGRHIVDILHKKKADLSDDDYAHMRKVNGYIKRHLAQKPSSEDIKDSRWRFSLMNWGHDPLND